jgi:hypothetical protein
MTYETENANNLNALAHDCFKHTILPEIEQQNSRNIYSKRKKKKHCLKYCLKHNSKY